MTPEGPDYESYQRSDAADFFLLLWTSTSFLLGVFGNTLVLSAAFSRGIRIDKTSLLIIKNLAVSDIFFNFIWVLPTLVTLLVGEWVLGDVVCKVTTYLQYTTAIATICFITIFSVNKYLRCKYPLKPWNITTLTAYIITAAVWAYAFLHPSLYLFSNLTRSDKRHILVYPPKSSCDYYHGKGLSNYWDNIDMLCAVIYTFIPSIFLLSANVGLLNLVRQKGKQNVKMSNVVLMIIITSVFLFSYSPYLVKYSVPILGLDKGLIKNWFKTLMNFMLYINSWFNPFAYYSTNRAFRRYTAAVFCCRKYSARSASVVASVVIENNVTTIEMLRSRSSSLATARELSAVHSVARAARTRSQSVSCSATVVKPSLALQWKPAVGKLQEEVGD